MLTLVKQWTGEFILSQNSIIVLAKFNFETRWVAIPDNGVRSAVKLYNIHAQNNELHSDSNRTIILPALFCNLIPRQRHT